MKYVLLVLLLNFSIMNTTASDKVIFCGVCKNVEKALPNMISSIEKTGKSFEDYRVFIYENNSSDKTVSLLKKWSKSNSRVSVISEHFSQDELANIGKSHTWDNLPFRTEILAYARNILLKRALSPEFDGYKYVIAMDMDFRIPWKTQEILNSLNQPGEWDAICANGVTSKGLLFDLYAYRHRHIPKELLQAI